MSAEMSGEQMQAKIATARRDAEGLKDKIKRKKDDLADASCMPPSNAPTVDKSWVHITNELLLTPPLQYARSPQATQMLFLGLA